MKTTHSYWKAPIPHLEEMLLKEEEDEEEHHHDHGHDCSCHCHD